MAPATSSKSADSPRRRRAGSLRLGLTAAFAFVSTLLIGIAGLWLDRWLAGELELRARAQLEGDLEHFRRHLAQFPDRARLAAESHWFGAAPRRPGELQASAMDVSGRLLAGAPFAWPAELLERAGATPVHGLVRSQDRAYSVLVGPARLGGAADTVLVGILRDKSEDQTVLLHFRTALVIAWIASSLAAGALGYFAAGRGLRPLRRMVDAAARIGAESLHKRLEVEDAPLEVQELAQSFNAMLERLDRAFRRLSDFSSDLAHELRSPLNSLMLQAQVALGKPRSEAELRQVLESSLEELERLSRMANDMLFIAKAEHAGHRLKRERVLLEEEAAKVFEYFEPLASERGVRLVLEGRAQVLADRSMLRRLLANLVSNALRHASRESAVRVRCSESGADALLEIANAGPGLSPEECERVFDRFFRVESARTAASEGAGLGLAIVRSIVELHGGGIAVDSASGLTTFRASFPAHIPRAALG